MQVVTFSTLYPNSQAPHHGIFTETSLRQQMKTGNVNAIVVAPVPWFPFKSLLFGVYGRYARTPRYEVRHGVEVHHPRYLALPGLGMYFAPWTLAHVARRAIDQLLRDGVRVDVIDAHYFYPDGVAAVMAGRALRRPVVVSALGSDISLLPRFRLPRVLIQWAARRAAAIVGVCDALKSEMVRLGFEAARVHTLRNGVDLDLFYPEPRAHARALLGLKRFTLLSVGHLVVHKGHEHVIGALAHLPDVELIVVGEGPEQDRLKTLAARIGVQDRVQFAGTVSQSSLRTYYSAADALVLASSREGWANVLLESMACGTPALASAVWGTPEVIRSPAAGRLLGERSANGVAAAVQALRADYPDRTATRKYAEQFSWQATAEAKLSLFSLAIHASPDNHVQLERSVGPETAV
ncbi:glycosyltransferase family 4 protein [Massilia sp. LXY-6]|uniref:glycosyltransferase family 4 protein n=1 Tax=Massilia sp. LXY-6 TaxID=3379823 RepID=UPI003F49C1BB